MNASNNDHWVGGEREYRENDAAEERLVLRGLRQVARRRGRELEAVDPHKGLLRA